jgi:hypothetical protein
MMAEVFVVRCGEPRVRELRHVDYDALPADLREGIDEEGGLGCDGGGRPGWWCIDCHWMGQEWVEEDDACLPPSLWR